MPGPLHGYRIVDLTSMVSGPSATMLLADQGADVIKVENPRGRRPHPRRRPIGAAGISASFLNNNRNKRSIVLDLKAPDGVAALKRLIAGADVFIQNFRTGVIERMGFGEEAVRALRAGHHLCLDQRLRRAGAVRPETGLRPADPGAVGAGQHPGRLRPGAAAAGAHHRARQADRRGRRQAITAALLARERTGAGPACAALDAGRGGRVPVGLRHGQPDLRRRRTAAAGGGAASST